MTPLATLLGILFLALVFYGVLSRSKGAGESKVLMGIVVILFGIFFVKISLLEYVVFTAPFLIIVLFFLLAFVFLLRTVGSNDEGITAFLSDGRTKFWIRWTVIVVLLFGAGMVWGQQALGAQQATVIDGLPTIGDGGSIDVSTVVSSSITSMVLVGVVLALSFYFVIKNS